MKDTRIPNAKRLADSVIEIIAEILAERPANPHDVVALARAEKLFTAGGDALMSAYEPEIPVCGASGGFSSRCELEEGHDGFHQRGLFKWDAESQAAFVRSMDR